VATSKAEPLAIRLIDHFGLGGLVEAVCGDDLAGNRATKTAVVGAALSRLGGPDPAGCLMVGDRSHDVIGAAAHHVSTLGAGWGYGSPGELADAGAVAVLDAPSALGRYLRLPDRTD
jgi:phosphoglycolate phosphatase